MAMQSAQLLTASAASRSSAGFNSQESLRTTTSSESFYITRQQVSNFVIQGANCRCLLSPRVGLLKRRLRIEANLGSTIGRPRSGHAVGTAGMLTTEVTQVPSWESLAEQLEGVKKLDRVAHAKERVFDAEQRTQVVFYRDNSSWCPYCQRVWLQLEEKKINYTVEKINMRCYGEKPTWYTRMVPSGLLPAVKLDGKLLTESLDIMFILEEKFPNNNPLLPQRGSVEFAALDGMLNLERKLFGAWLTRLTRSWGDMGAFETTMDSVNSTLEKFKGPYFLGHQFTMVDAVYAPFLERIAASMPYWPGIKVRGVDRWPAVNLWFDAMDSRPAYQAIKSDDFGITHNLEPQIGSCKSASAGASYRALIDGKDGSWDLPLKPEMTAWGADDGTGKDGAREEAARSLIENYEKVVGFALRGVKDGEKFKDAVDLGFRGVAHALLFGSAKVDIPRDLPREVAMAAAYLRDRVGVPRDLTYPAARQLRAHLQWLVKECGYKF